MPQVINEILNVLSLYHSIFFIVLMLIIADLALYLRSPRFYAGFGIPIWIKTTRNSKHLDMAQLQGKLETDFQRYKFRSDGNTVWFRDGGKSYMSGWNLVLGLTAKGIIIRKGDNLRCRIHLNLAGLLMPCLLVDFLRYGSIPDTLFTTLLLFIFGYLVLYVIMLVIRFNNFEKVFESLVPGGFSTPSFTGKLQ